MVGYKIILLNTQVFGDGVEWSGVDALVYIYLRGKNFNVIDDVFF
jgi:hypothetical protein